MNDSTDITFHIEKLDSVAEPGFFVYSFSITPEDMNPSGTSNGCFFENKLSNVGLKFEKTPTNSVITILGKRCNTIPISDSFYYSEEEEDEKEESILGKRQSEWEDEERLTKKPTLKKHDSLRDHLHEMGPYDT